MRLGVRYVDDWADVDPLISAMNIEKDEFIMKENGAKESYAWYKRPLSNGGHFFTPYRKTFAKYTYVGNGVEIPSPKEVADYYNSKAEEEGSTDFVNGNVFVKYDSAKTSETPLELPSGSYYYEPPSGPDLPQRLTPFDLRTDSYVEMPGFYDKMQLDIKDFLDNEAIYREMGIQYRRGILTYGPPGNGKTSLIRHLIKHEVPEDTIVVFYDLIPGRSFLDTMRKTLANRLKVSIFEELAAVLENSRLENVLDFLDGERSLDKSLVFATTNYAEKLPANIVDRPSRFDKLYKMGDPNDASRKSFLNYFLNGKVEVTDEDVKASKDLSVAALREVALLVRVRKFTIQKAIASLQHHHELVKKEFSETRSLTIGFGNRRDRYEDD